MSVLNVKINEKEKSYPIFITNDNPETLQTSILEQLKSNNYIVVISQKVYKLYNDVLNFPKEKVLIIKDGEAEKNSKTLSKILDFALKQKLSRKDGIIAIGGGVIGDLSGFAASVYMRGINFIQVPTTLLACTDSSVGGKTAINTKYGKNLIGSFYQPKAVFINVNFLKTLDERQFKSGMGEIVKYGFIEKSCNLQEDLNLMNYLSENFHAILERDILTLMELISICIKLKISVVEKDEKENGLRMILNYGHTYAHAIEKITNYKKYTHGECVAKGLEKAINIAFKLGKIDKEYKFLCKDIINKFNFKNIPEYDKNKLIQIMTTDKKSEQNSIKYVLPTSYANVEIFNFSQEELKELL